MASFDAVPGIPSLIDQDEQDKAGAYGSLDQLANLFAPLASPPSSYVDFFTQLAATGVPPTSYAAGKANALNYAGTPKTGPYTAVSNELVLVDASAGSVAITLPPSPATNDLVAVVVSALTTPNVVTVSSNGNYFNIAGGAQTLPLPLLGEIAQFQYVGGGIWVAALMAPPGAVDPAGTAQAAADAVRADLSAQIQDLASRAAPAPRTTTISPAGQFAVGATARGPIVNVGFPVNGARIRVDQPPTGQAAIFQVVDSTGATYPLGGTPYTVTIPTGTTPYALDDSSPTGWAIPDAAQMKLNFTQVGTTFPGAGITVELTADFGGSTGTGIGAVGDLATTAVGGASISLTWSYSGTTPPSTYLIVTKQGASAPTSPSDGTQLTVAGSDTAAQITGLTAATAYSFKEWPVASDGTLGTPATLTNIITGAVDTTPPGPVTGLKVTAGSTSNTLQWTWPTDADTAGVTIRRKTGTTNSWTALATITTAPSEGKPAGGGLTATGAGLNFTIGQGNSFTDSGLNPSSNYVYGLWTYDAAGNYRQTAVSILAPTTAAPTAGLGDNGKIPATYQPVGTETWAGAVNDNFTWDQGFKHGEQGPTDRSNVDIITDPADGVTKCARMRMRRITTGWATSATSIYTKHPGWFYINGTSPAQYQQDGTGWYGARGNSTWASQASGGWELVWKVANADGTAATSLGYGTKGLTAIVMPDTGWPDDELDWIEIFTAAQLQANMHYKTSSGGNGQVWSGHGTTQPFNIFQKITTTLLWEPAPAGTGGNTGGGIGRIRLWHKQAGVTGDSGVGTPLTWFDTDKPYVADNATDDKMQRLLAAANKGQMGFAVAYNPGANTVTNDVVTGSNFSCGTGTSGNNRTGSAALLYKVSQWKAA